MPCGACGQARQQFFGAVRTGNVHGAVQAIRRGIAINVDKARGVDVDAKYGGPQAAVKATPYRRRPPERSS